MFHVWFLIKILLTIICDENCLKDIQKSLWNKQVIFVYVAINGFNK